MVQKRIIMVVLVSLFIISLFSIGGQAGFSRGYMMGYLAAGGETGAMAPGMIGYSGFAPFFLGIGLFFKAIFFFFFLMVAAKLIRFGLWRWRTADSGGSWDEKWQKWDMPEHFRKYWQQHKAHRQRSQSMKDQAEPETDYDPTKMI